MTDMTGATKFAFWTAGKSGGENAMFKAAGKEVQDNSVAYANATSVTLGSEWKRGEVDLVVADLTDVTHLLDLN